MKKLILPPYFGYWCVFFIAPLPILYIILHYVFTLGQFEALEEKMELLHVRKEQSDLTQKRRHSVLNSVSQSDPLYIDKYLESLLF